LKRRIRNRMRSVTKRVITIAHALRHKGPEGEEKRRAEYAQLLHTTRQILNDAKRVLDEVDHLPRRRKTRMRRLRAQLETIADRVRSVVRQTKGRVFGGLTKLPGKLVSLFEPHTEIIRKGDLKLYVPFVRSPRPVITCGRTIRTYPDSNPLLWL
jgi:transposase, IS5 family